MTQLVPYLSSSSSIEFEFEFEFEFKRKFEIGSVVTANVRRRIWGPVG